MNVCRNRLWTLGVRLPGQIYPEVGRSIRINPVIAHKWHNIASAHQQKPFDHRFGWSQLMTAKINESFVVHLSSSRSVHIHKREIKYDEKVDAKETKSEETKSDESGNVEQRANSELKIPGEKVSIESSAAPSTATSTDDLLATDPEKKLGLFARFKLMSKQYWYVLLPVHVVTSCFWFGGFYYLSSSGVDIPTLLESLSISETIIAKLRDSTMGHLAIAYMCYKIMTPVRYTVTLGGTTVAIKYLSQWGYIRPMPSKEKLKQIYEDQKAKFKQKD